MDDQFFLHVDDSDLCLRIQKNGVRVACGVKAMDERFVERQKDAADLALVVECLEIVERNADESVTWLQSYVSDDGKKTFCVYDAPNPEAIRKTATRNGLPVECITQVRVLDPYFYLGKDHTPHAS
jgi:hypothetical protein